LIIWRVYAIRKRVITKESLAGAGVAVGIEEALDDGVVISGLQVVEARLCNCGLPLRAI
jgi:hypothetical protein